MSRARRPFEDHTEAAERRRAAEAAETARALNRSTSPPAAGDGGGRVVKTSDPNEACDVQKLRLDRQSVMAAFARREARLPERPTRSIFNARRSLRRVAAEC